MEGYRLRGVVRAIVHRRLDGGSAVFTRALASAAKATITTSASVGTAMAEELSVAIEEALVMHSGNSTKIYATTSPDSHGVPRWLVLVGGFLLSRYTN